MAKISATEAARNWSNVLNRVRYRREVFSIERGGEVIARLEPVARPITTLAGLAEVLANRSVAGGFADDLETVVSQQPSLPDDPWAS